MRRVPPQGRIETGQLNATELSFAARGLGIPARQQHHEPLAELECATDLERRSRETLLQSIRQVVVAWNHEHGNAEPGNRRADRRVARGLVLHEIATQQQRGGWKMPVARAVHARAQALQRAHAAQRVLRTRQQVRIAELDQAQRGLSTCSAPA